MGRARIRLVSLLLAIVMLLASTGCAFAKDGNDAAYDHMSFIQGFEDGTIRPDKTLTRAEAEQMLYNLGVLDKAPAEGDFSTSPVIPRGDFSDLITENMEGIQQSDIIQGYPDGSLGLDRGLTRAEAATIINRALGRVADRFTLNISDDIRVMPDMTSSHWAYYELAEAVTSHNCVIEDGYESWTEYAPGVTGLEEGWRHINGELFYVDENGVFKYKTEVNGLTLDVDGRFTTNNPELDKLLTEEIQKIVNNGMTQEEKLHAVYNYMMENYGYRGAGEVEVGATGWEEEFGLAMLKNKKGNCYSWAAAFTYLAQKVGYDAEAISGEAVSPKGSQRFHAWTEIVIDDVAYTFDPELEAVYGANVGEDYDLFKKAYGEAEWQYVKSAPPAAEVPEEPGEPDASLVAILDSVHGNAGEMPMMMDMALARSNEEFFIGTAGLDYKAGVAREPMMTSVAHSVVVLEMNEGADIEAAKKAIKENADPYKWICVGVADENVLVESEGNYIILIMTEKAADFADSFHKYFR